MHKTIIPIDKPQTWVRVTQNYRYLFSPKLNESKLPKWALQLRRSMLRYNKYKDDIRQHAKDANFTLPDRQILIVFCFPMSMSVRTKVAENRLKTGHKVKPDIDNITKALFDSLKRQDSSIYDVALHKQWLPKGEKGRIEIYEFDKDIKSILLDYYAKNAKLSLF
jgi:Holliday junction resolvase RusA-like endonuclease